MLIEDLLSLSLVRACPEKFDSPRRYSEWLHRPGDRSHLIRWDDGDSTIPRGKVREYDEYTAALTELRRTHCLRAEAKAEQHDERAETSARDYTAGVRRT